MSQEDDDYLKTIGLLEPDVSAVDAGASLASIAVSLRRIADALDHIKPSTLGAENALLKRKLALAIGALDEISDGYLRGEREMEAHASNALGDIKDLDGK